MSLGIVIKSPEGIVLAAESRVTLTVNGQNGQPSHMVNFDNATKLFSFKAPHNHIGVVTYGQAAIGQRTAHSFVPEFESTLPEERLTVAEMAQRISDFLYGTMEYSYARKLCGTEYDLYSCWIQ